MDIITGIIALMLVPVIVFALILWILSKVLPGAAKVIGLVLIGAVIGWATRQGVYSYKARKAAKDAGLDTESSIR